MDRFPSFCALSLCRCFGPERSPVHSCDGPPRLATKFCIRSPTTMLLVIILAGSIKAKPARRLTVTAAKIDSHGGVGPDSSSRVDLELHQHFLQPPELLALIAHAAAVPESDWRPCSCGAEATAAGPAKECTHVEVGQEPAAAGVLRRLALLTGSSTGPLETLPLVRYRPGSEATPLHVDHLPDGARVVRS